jgi:hypothetical protein
MSLLGLPSYASRACAFPGTATVTVLAVEIEIGYRDRSSLGTPSFRLVLRDGRYCIVSYCTKVLQTLLRIAHVEKPSWFHLSLGTKSNAVCMYSISVRLDTSHSQNLVYSKSSLLPIQDIPDLYPSLPCLSKIGGCESTLIRCLGACPGPIRNSEPLLSITSLEQSLLNLRLVLSDRCQSPQLVNCVSNKHLDWKYRYKALIYAVDSVLSFLCSIDRQS